MASSVAFETFQVIVNEQRTERHWNSIFQELMSFYSPSIAGDICKLFLRRLEQVETRDPAVVEKVVHMYHFWCEWHHASDERDGWRHLYNLELMILRDHLMPLGGQKITSRIRISRADVFYSALLNDANFFRVLIKFGFHLVDRDVSPVEVRFAEWSLYATGENLVHLGLHAHVNVDNVHEIWYEAKALAKKFKDHPRGYRRAILLAMMTFGIARLPWVFAQSMKHYFSVLREPFISKTEILQFLVSVYGQNVPRAALVRMSETYAQLFPYESGMSFRPRSLKHLCRCSVREILIRNRKGQVFPAIVRKLEIPHTLKDFLLGESEQDIL